MSEPAIAVTGLEKQFGCKRVLAGLDLSVPAGSVAARHFTATNCG